MEKKSMSKIFYLLLLIALLFIIFGEANVSASSYENAEYFTNTDLNEIEEVKIMKYDAKTDETTEVDMDEIKQILANSKEESETSNNIHTANDLKYTSKLFQQVMPMSTGSAIKDAVCKVKSSGGEASAILVGKKVALTAAHCVWDTKTKNQFNNFTLYPGYDNRKGSQY